MEDIKEMESKIQQMMSARSQAAREQLLPYITLANQLATDIVRMRRKKQQTEDSFYEMFKIAYPVIYEVHVQLEDSCGEDPRYYFVNERKAREKYETESNSSQIGIDNWPVHFNTLNSHQPSLKDVVIQFLYDKDSRSQII